MVQAEKVLEKLVANDLQFRMAEYNMPKVGERNAAEAKLHEARVALKKAEDELAAAEDDEAKKTAVDEAKKVVEAEEAASKAAQEALEQHGLGFDFVAELRKLLGEQPGVLTVSVSEAKTGEDLRELGDMGTWETHWGRDQHERARQDLDAGAEDHRCGLPVPRDGSRQAAAEAVRRDQGAGPRGPLQEARGRAGQEKTDTFEKTLLEAAKAKVQDKITELESKKTADIEEQFTPGRASSRRSSTRPRRSSASTRRSR